MNILCTICARANSKGLRNKNIKKLNDIPLIVHTIAQAKRTRLFSDIVLSTDSDKIEKICIKEGVKSIGKRPKYLSNDSISKINVIQHLVKNFEKKINKSFDIIVDLDVTSPLRNISDITQAISLFKKKKADNLITACKAKKNPYFNMVELNNNKISLVKNFNKKITSRQSAPTVYEMNASIYIWKRSVLFSKNCLFRKNTILFEMPNERSIDIDSIQDFNYVKFLMSK